MPIVIKEVIVRTTVEKAIRETPVDERLVRRVRDLVKEDIEESRHRRERNRNR